MSLTSTEMSPLRTPQAFPEPAALSSVSSARTKFRSPFAPLELGKSEVETLERAHPGGDCDWAQQLQ